MRWVVDCSFAAALFLPDEASAHVRDFFSSLSEEDELVVPVLWRYELANVLILCERRNRLNHEDVMKIFSLLSEIGFRVDVTEEDIDSQKLYELGIKHHLTSYDAAYLALALRMGAGIATLDQKLRKAAEACKLRTY